MKAWALSIFMISLHPQSLKAEDLTIRFEDLQELIMAQHKGVKLGEEQIKAAEQRIHSVDRSFLPKTSLDLGTAHQKEADGTGETSAFWRMNIETNLYRGGRDEAAKSLTENQVEIKRIDARAFLRSQTFHARSAYLKLVFLQKLSDVQLSSKNDFDTLKKSIQVKINSGLLTESSLQLLSIERDEIDRQLIAFNSQRKSQEEELCLILGLSHRSQIKLTSNFASPKSKDVSNQNLSAASKNLPEMQKFNILIKRSSIQAAIKNEWWRPDLSLFVSYGSFATKDRFEPGPLPDREMALGLRLSIDLEGKQTLDRESFAKEAEKRALQYQKQLLNEELQHKSEEFLRDMDTRLKVIKSYNDSLQKSEILRKRLLNEFDRGIVDSNDVFAIIRAIQVIKRERIEEELNYFLSRNAYDSMTED